MKTSRRLIWAFAFWLSLLGTGALASNLAVTDHTTTGGTRILVQDEPDTPLVAIDVFIKTGGAPEDASRPGLAAFVAKALLTGTASQSEDTLTAQIGSLGGNVSVTSDRNFTQIRTLALASRFKDAAYLVSDVLKNATFNDAGVQATRAEMLLDLQQRSDDVYEQTYDQLKTKLYQGQEVAPTELGSSSVIASLRPADLHAFYDRYYTADNVVISVVGNVDPSAAVQDLTNYLFDWDRATARRLPSVLPDTAVPLTQIETVKSYRGDLLSGYVMVGYLVPGAGTSDYPVMLLLNALLGGMKTSLLFTNLREKEGLGYDTASSYAEDVGITDLTGYILSPGDKPAKPADAPTVHNVDAVQSPESPASGPSFSGVRAALIDQFRLMRDQPPADAMLARAKRFVIGSYLTRHERLLDRAYWLGFSETALKSQGGYKFDTGFADVINAVTAADIQRVARKYLSDGYVISMVLPGDPNAGDVSR